nr:glucose 1-dehydrogenase [Cytophagales bacterium]
MITDTDLIGKTAVITGSTQGIGYETAKLLLQQGCSVVINGRNSERCERVASELQEFATHEAEVISIAADISTETDCRAFFEQAQGAFPKIDILMLNAAYDPPYAGSIEAIPEEQIDQTIQTNIKSQITLSQLFLPEMAQNKDGVVILTGSAASQRGSNRYAVYAMSKAALSHLTMSLAAEYGPHNIRVNCLAPSVIRTEFTKAMWGDPAKHTSLSNSYPLRRIGEPEEIAAMAVALCGKAGNWMTGQTLVIDGGQMAAVGCHYDM